LPGIPPGVAADPHEVVNSSHPVAGAKAVFLDRDGVINENVYYEDSGEWEAPRRASDYRPIKSAFAAMRQLEAGGFLLFIVSNQPNQAKEKATRADHDSIHAGLSELLRSEGVTIQEAFYCFHHPNGSVAGLSGPCECRKPSPYFLTQAAKRWSIDLSKSWMVGDRDTDIDCGVNAGTRTIRIGPVARDCADFHAENLADAARIILGPGQGPQ